MTRKKYKSPVVSFLNDEGDIEYPVGSSEQGGQDPWQGDDGSTSNGTPWGVTEEDENYQDFLDAISDGLYDMDGNGVIDWDDYDLWIGGE